MNEYIISVGVHYCIHAKNKKEAKEQALSIFGSEHLTTEGAVITCEYQGKCKEDLE